MAFFVLEKMEFEEEREILNYIFVEPSQPIDKMYLDFNRPQNSLL